MNDIGSAVSGGALAQAAQGFRRHLEGCAEPILADAEPLRIVATWAAQHSSPEYVSNARLMAAALDAPLPAIELDDCAMAFPQRDAAAARAAIFVALYDAGVEWLREARER